MDQIQFDASEIRALERTLDLSHARIRREAAGLVRKTAFEIERGAKLRAPVDTGALRNSISTTVSDGGASGPITAEVGPEVSYGLHQEVGTSRMAPQPYLGPAFDEVEPSFIAALDDLAGKTLG